MGYILYSTALFVLALGTTLYLTRTRWLPLLTSGPLYSRLPTSFREDIEAGLHSSAFDLTGNVEGDSRQGLDEAGKKEVLRIMKGRGVGFDEARRILMQERFRREGVGSDGVPRDPKFVSFS